MLQARSATESQAARWMVCIVTSRSKPGGKSAAAAAPAQGGMTKTDQRAARAPGKYGVLGSGRMTQDELKKQVAEAALKCVVEDAIVGVGSGSTVNFFIDALAGMKNRLDGAVAASEASAERLRKHGIRVVDLNSVPELAVYVDGADEVTEHLAMIKGGGGALTREKIVAAVARQFVCICDASKLVPVLGKFPLPVEVIPMARSYVGRELLKRKAQPVLREKFTTDNGNLILDCHGLTILDPPALEAELNGIAGVVTNGLFARRGADVLLLATAEGVKTFRKEL